MKKFSLKLDRPLDLDSTLDCGQTFRWVKEGDWWKGVVRDTALFLRLEGEELHVRASSGELLGEDIDTGLKTYLGLEDDLGEIHLSIGRNLERFEGKTREISVRALEEARGLRILRQDPFEMVVQYILSTRNNIPTIRRMSDQLAALFPENRIELEGETFFSFIDLEQAKRLSEQQLLNLKIAFRVPWLKALFEAVNSQEYFQKLRALPLERKLAELMAFKGVGYKVGSCVTLFAYGELNSFPVDVWISRVMRDLYGVHGSTKKVMEFGMENFYPYAGYYQEALFRHYRTLKLGRNDR